MASSFTTSKRFEKPANGDDVNTWNVPVNADWDAIDTCFSGITNLNATAVSGAVALTLTQYRPPIVIISGTLTADVIYVLPAGIGGQWTVFNNTAGSFAVTWGTAGGGTSAGLPQGFRTLVMCDGTNVARSDNPPVVAPGSNTQVLLNANGFLGANANLFFSGTTLTLKSTLALLGATSGFVSISAPNAPANNSYVLPSADGSNGQFLATNGSGVLSWQNPTTATTAANALALNGQPDTFYTNIPARLGFTPANVAGQVFSGPVGRDNFFYMDLIGGSPILTFGPSGSYIVFDRSSNLFSFAILGSTRLTLDSGGNFAVSGNMTAAGSTVWTAGNDGPGSGLDADFLDSQDSSFYTNIPARLGYMPLNPANNLADLQSIPAALGILGLSGSIVGGWSTTWGFVVPIEDSGPVRRLMIVQGGLITGVTANNQVTLNFPFPFSNAPLFVAPITREGTFVSGNDSYAKLIGTPSATQAVFANQLVNVANTIDIQWMAIGF